MDDKLESLSDLALDINGALVRLGKSNQRHEFNTKFWSCNRDGAVELINDYRDRLEELARSMGWDESDRHLFSPLRS